MVIQLRSINEEVERAAKTYIQQTDDRFSQQLRQVAIDIEAHRDERPIVLISGPSGSGKTTTALKLEAMLDRDGCETHTLSMDHFFIPLSEQEQRRMERGELDLEGPSRLDVPFMNETLSRMADCQPVRLPYFDFVTNTRRMEEQTFLRRPHELLILEGIHALNPAVITMPDEMTTRLYVSVRTRVQLSDGREIHPEKIRLLRRMLRDKLYRGRPFEETLARYPSVQQGENRYIMPYKYRSSYDVDTFMPYEIGAYRPLVLEQLAPMQSHDRLKELMELLQQTAPLPLSDIPPESLVREFLGGGVFAY